MQQLNNSLYKPTTQRNVSTKVCFLMTNAFTCRSSKHQNISALMKLATLKQQHKQYHLNLKNKTHYSNKSKQKQKKKRSIDKMKEGLLLNMSISAQRDIDSAIPYKNYIGNNDKFIEKIKIEQLDPSQSKKYNYSCLEKCRMATQSYDQLKMQIINKIKIKRSRKSQRAKTNYSNEKQKIIIFDGVLQKDRNKENQILIRSESIQKNYLIRENRYRSQSDSHKKPQRYTQISVADFMDQPESKISGSISKKFDQFRKTYQKQPQIEKQQHQQNQNKILNQINLENRTIQYPLNSFSHRQKIVKGVSD